MPAIKVEQIGGMLPAWDPHLLPAGQAAAALNLYAFGGRMEGWRKPSLLRSLNNSAAQMVFRIPTTVGAYATAYLVFRTQPNQNDAVTIDQLTYRFTTLLSQPNDVLIGATLATTAFNFMAAILTDLGLQTNAGKIYGSGTAANQSLGATSGLTTVPLGSGSGSSSYVPCVICQASTQGTSQNGLPVSTTAASARLIWLSSPTSLANTTSTLTGGVSPTLNNGITAASSWLEFLDPDTNVVRSQVLNDTFQRYYIASGSQRPQYNTAARIAAGQPAFLLGINPPLVAATVNPQGGGNLLQLPTSNVTSNGSTVSFTANTVRLTPFVPTADLQLADIVFGTDSTDTVPNWAGLIYADASTATAVATVPGQLLGTGSIGTGMSANTNCVSTFANPIALIKGEVYWIGMMMDTTETLFKNSTGSSSSFTFTNTFTNGPPGVAPNGTANQADMQLFAVCNTSDVLEARAYVYTWVTAYNEESAPSPFVIGTGWTDGNWLITFPQPSGEDMGVQRNIVTTRIYRTVTGSNGVSQYYWVADIPVTQPFYQDTALDSVIAENITIASTNFFPPPANLEGLTIMPNGLMAGFVGNQIWICQPYLPHAWPPGNVFNTDFPIVGLGFTNGALVACTEANPFVLSGANPSVMSITKCQPPDPCITRASILSTDLGVYYMSPNGLIQVTNLSQCTNVTELWITRERWAQLVPLLTPRAVPLAGCYYCHGSDSATAADGFAIELNQDNTSFTIWPQPGGHRVGFTQLNAPNGFVVNNVSIDPWTGIALFVQNGQVYYMDFSNALPIMRPYSYTTKIYQQNNMKNFAAARAFFTVPASTPAQNVTPNLKPHTDPSWLTLQPGQYGILLTYADFDGTGNMVLVGANEIRQSRALMRLPSGFKAEQWQFTVLAQVPISNIQLATSVTELKNV